VASSAKTVSVTFTGDAASVDAALEQIAAKAEDTGAHVEVLGAQIDELGNKTAVVRVSADGAEAEAKLAELKAELASLDTSATLHVGVDDSEAAARLAAIKAHLDELQGRVAAARVSVDDADGQAQLSSIEAALGRVDKRVASPKIGTVGIAQSEADLHRLEGDLTNLENPRPPIPVHLDTAQAEQSSHLLLGSLLALSPAIAGFGGEAVAALMTIPTMLAPIPGNLQAIAAGVIRTGQEFKSASGDGGQLAMSINEMTTAFQAYLSSAEGQAEINAMVQAGDTFWAEMLRAIETAGQGVIAMGAAVGPVLDAFGVSAEHVAAKFESWASGGGAERFASWAMSNLPNVGHIIDELGGTIENIAKGLGFWANAWLPIVNAGADVLNFLTRLNPALTGIAGSLIGGALLWEKFGGSISGIIGAVSGGIQAIERIPGAIGGAIEWLTKLDAKLGGTGQAAEEMGGAVTGGSATAAGGLDALAGDSEAAAATTVGAEEEIAMGADGMATGVAAGATEAGAALDGLATEAVADAAIVDGAEAAMGLGTALGVGGAIVGGLAVAGLAAYGIYNNVTSGGDTYTPTDPSLYQPVTSPYGGSYGPGAGTPGLPGTGGIVPLDSGATLGGGGLAAQPSVTVHAPLNLSLSVPTIDGTLPASTVAQVKQIATDASAQHASQIVATAVGALGG